jgi:hypothetical protein
MVKVAVLELVEKLEVTTKCTLKNGRGRGDTLSQASASSVNIGTVVLLNDAT